MYFAPANGKNWNPAKLNSLSVILAHTGYVTMVTSQWVELPTVSRISSDGHRRSARLGRLYRRPHGLMVGPRGPPGDPTSPAKPAARAGALAYLAAWDVHRAKLFGRCERKNGIAAFERLVAQVMGREPDQSAGHVFFVVDGSSHRGQRATRLRARRPKLVLVHTPVHDNWLNQIEIYFSTVQHKLLTSSDFAGITAPSAVSSPSKSATCEQLSCSRGHSPIAIFMCFFAGLTSHRAYPPSQSQQIRQDTWFNLGLAAMCAEDNASSDRL